MILRNTNILKILQSFEWKPGDIKSQQVTFPTRYIEINHHSVIQTHPYDNNHLSQNLSPL